MSLWVFAYGSLIWHPDFPVAEQRIARLSGWRRSFCMQSTQYRGTTEAPGLVLALDRCAASHCDGLALRVAPGHETATLDRLRARELNASAYHEVSLPVTTRGGMLDCLTYVIDRTHPHYCGGMTLEDQAAVIARASGERGPNRDYLLNTASHLAELGLEDADLVWLAARLRDLA